MGSFKNIFQINVFIFLLGVGFSACNNNQEIYLVIGEKVSKTELLTVEQLKEDLENVSRKSVNILVANDDLPDVGLFFIVGTSNSNSIIEDLIANKEIVLSESFPGKRGGIWAKVTLQNNRDAIILAGSDVQGAQYATYEYCEEILGVDPYEYWTGKIPGLKNISDLVTIENKVIPPPEIPILSYFENDVDELANLKEPLLEYDWESYTGMINSLVRLKYNAIHLFDMLGRPEFFLRPEYKKIRPGYDIRISYVDSMINYAHDMGMMVQIDLSLGYKIKQLEQDKADCWSKNKDEWISAWKYYLEKTPIGKADIFSLRPRNQVWDWEYKSSCGENKIDAFNEVYFELGKLIDELKPGAVKIATCYSDGMEMFNNGFNPPKDWIIAWSDDGWGGFKYLPEDTKGYKFGAYMHAGYWKNHTIHDPYPEKLDSIMKMMSEKYKANYFYEINGQQFRPFLLNIEAFSKIAESPEQFDGESFYREWTTRYFGENASPYAVLSMKKLHEAQFNNISYVEHLWEIRELISYLSDSPIERPGKAPVPYDYKLVEDNLEHVQKRIQLLNQAFDEATKGYELLTGKDTFYHDYILLPINLYLDLLVFENSLQKTALLKKEFEDTGDKSKLDKALNLLQIAKKDLNILSDRCMEGDKNPKWKGWYDPLKRRPNNGFPTIEMIEHIELNISKM